MKKSIAVAFCLLIIAPAFAQQSVDELLEQVRTDRLELGQSRADIDQGRSLEEQLSEVRAALDAATRNSEQLKAVFETNERELQQLTATRRQESGDLSELFGVVRLFAGDAAGALKNSLVSAQYGDRSDLLARLSEPGHIPAPSELHDLHVLMLQEMMQSGRVARFSTEIVDAAGVPAPAEIVRVGVFNLITADKFLRYEINNGTIQELARQPARRFRNDAKNLHNATGGVTALAIDPTAGQLLGRLIQTPGVTDRLKQGGPVGYIIVALGLLGLLIGGYRLFYLSAAGARIRSQLKSDTPSPANALGRILSVYGQNPQIDTETLELKLDEAIIRETPGLEKWQVALKVIAAVAPLLGLLGTVIGMIETFHQITLSGTSDPRLMADGISKALVTTMLGLLVAIPMVLIHSIVASRSKHLIEILEEQSAAIIAKQAENKR